MFESIVLEVAALAGFSAFVVFVVNVLKIFNVVKDGTADKWVAGLNLLGVLALYVVRLFIPEWNVTPVDSVLAEVATVGGYVIGYVLMLWGSKLTYSQVRGLPVIGKSHNV